MSEGSLGGDGRIDGAHVLRCTPRNALLRRFHVWVNGETQALQTGAGLHGSARRCSAQLAAKFENQSLQGAAQNANGDVSIRVDAGNRPARRAAQPRDGTKRVRKRQTLARQSLRPPTGVDGTRAMARHLWDTILCHNELIRIND